MSLGAIFLESTKSVAMRRLATAYTHQKLYDAFPRANFITNLVGRTLSVEFAPPLWWWALLQLPRLRVWLRARRVARAAVATIKADVVLRVGFG